MRSLKDVIMERDGLSEDEYKSLVYDAKQDFDSGGIDPESLLENWFDLEPDYVFDLLDEFKRLDKSDTDRA